MNQDSTNWVIRIQGYGSFEFQGTEAEAEEMRAHKAQWERGNGMKWRADLSRESDRIQAEIAERFDAGDGVEQRLFTRLKKARAAEAVAV